MKKTIFYITIISFLLSCKNELERPTWHVNMITPILHAELNIDDIVIDSNIKIEEDNEFGALLHSVEYLFKPTNGIFFLASFNHKAKSSFVFWIGNLCFRKTFLLETTVERPISHDFKSSL